MKESNLLVTDLSAAPDCPKRTHEVFVDGELHKVDFEQGKDTELPYRVAVKFMQEGFIVKDADGNAFRLPAKTDETVRVQIGMDEVIAKYTELTTEALKIRAATRVGGENFLDEKADREQIITFLKGAQPIDDEYLLLDDGDDELSGDGIVGDVDPLDEDVVNLPSGTVDKDGNVIDETKIPPVPEAPETEPQTQQEPVTPTKKTK